MKDEKRGISIAPEKIQLQPSSLPVRYGKSLSCTTYFDSIIACASYYYFLGTSWIKFNWLGSMQFLKLRLFLSKTHKNYKWSDMPSLFCSLRMNVRTLVPTVCQWDMKKCWNLLLLWTNTSNERIIYFFFPPDKDYFLIVIQNPTEWLRWLGLGFFSLCPTGFF